jgi:cell division protein FtsW (lipid II flippase)
MPWFYFLGTSLVYALVAVVYAFYARKENRYWPYLFGWLVINIFILTPMILYAALKIQDRGWGTR